MKDRLKHIYDKLLLIAMLTMLLGSALFLVLEIGQVRADLKTGRWAVGEADPIPAKALDLTYHEEMVAKLASPFNEEMGSNPLFSLPPPPEKDPDVTDSDSDGMLDRYEMDNGLDKYNPSDAYADPDEDGFTNIEEFRSGTVASDPSSFPAPIAKLRLGGVITKPFKLRFVGKVELPSGTKFQLNLRTLEQTYFTEMGEEVEGYELVTYDEQSKQRDLVKEDVSVLTLQKGEENVKLVRGQDITRYEKIARMIFLIDGSRYTVKVDDELVLKDKKYKVIDIRLDRVLLRDLLTGKIAQIGRLTDAEKKSLMQAVGGGDRDNSTL